MGTRSLTHIYSDEYIHSEATPLCTIYRQFDGYPEAMGQDIKDCLGSKKVVNGYNDAATQVNGMGCAAAMLIAALKEGCGNAYVYPAGSRDCGEEFTYRVYPKGDSIHIRIEGGGLIYQGPLNEFNPALQTT